MILLKILAGMCILLIVLSTMASFYMIGRDRRPLTEASVTASAIFSLVVIMLLAQVVIRL